MAVATTRMTSKPKYFIVVVSYTKEDIYKLSTLKYNFNK